MLKQISFFVVFVLFFVSSNALVAQENFVLNLSTINAQSLTKESLHRFSIINSGGAEQITVRGSIKFRSSKSVLNYQYRTSLRSGVNNMQDLARGVNYSFSTSSLEQLFKKHGKLPNGEFEYCVDLYKSVGEGPDAVASECVFDENEDLFLMNLMEPEDKAKIDELFPMFSWSVNSPLINELTYKMRVAEIKEGQRANTAVMRNRPMYEQNGLRFPTQNYPVTARSLEYWQPYAWTVDAYYRDILMGSAETWEFMIINDSLLQSVPKDMAYIEVNVENGTNTALLLGEIKLKYIEKNMRKNTLNLVARNKNGRVLKSFKEDWNVGLGENRKTINLYDYNLFRHGKFYHLELRDEEGQSYKIRFQYFNPDFVK